MPDISKRAAVMPPSPIRKLVPFAEAAKRQGRKVYHLNIGQPDIPTPQGMMDAFRRHEVKILAYGHSAGLWEYREGLAKYYHKFGINVSAGQVLVTTAGSEAIIFALMATMDPGDEILIPEPFYTNYNGFAVEAGVRIVPVTCRAEEGFRLPDDAEIESRITPRTRAIMICNPNNPTGYVYDQEELQRLRRLVLKHDLFFLSDEVYREFVYDGRRHFSVMQLNDIDDRAILLDSISKRYSACGARLGCLVTRNEKVLETALRFGQARLCPPTMEQLAGIAALQTPQKYFDEVLVEYQARREVVFDGLAEIPGVVGQKPPGAFYAIVKLPIDDADRFCTWLLQEFHHDNETVMLAPAAGFYATPGLGKDEVRIAFVLNTTAMKRSMHLLKQALQVYPGRQ